MSLERYTLHQAQGEAAKLREKVNSGEAKEYGETEHILEREGDSKEESKEKERTPDEIGLEKQKWADFTHSLKGVLTTLLERESQRLSLIEPAGIGKLAAGINTLESFASREAIKADEIHSCLLGIASGLRSIGEVRRPGMREDEDSLTKVFVRVRSVRDGIDGIRHAFSGSEDAIGAVSKGMNALTDSADHARYVLARKKQALREYLGR